jgi:hypothetical protein
MDEKANFMMQVANAHRKPEPFRIIDWASGNGNARGIITNDGPCPACDAEEPLDHDEDCDFAVE